VTFLDTGPFAPVDEDGHRESIRWEFTTMRESMKYILSFVVALLAGTVSTPAHAQDGVQAHAQDKTAEIDQIFSWATPATPGCAVAVSQHGELIVNRAYGLADLEREVPISPDTVFDIGSVVKQFVAAAVLILVEEEQVSLSEDVRTYIPELPDTGHRVTVDHLLTHTGGIRDWTGILPLAATPTDALTIALRQRGLNFAPGEEWSYSNSGYVLLKEIVARTSGMSFSEFTRQRLFEPLGMTLTHYQYDWREVVKNRALAYEQEDGRWRVDMLLDNERGGGGGLLSTASDLLIWNDALTSGRLGAFVTEKIQEPARLNNGRTLGYARGLFLDTTEEVVGSSGGGKVVWHTGSAAAYNSMLARFPEQGLSIAILCNAGDIASTGQFARRIFNLLVPTTGATGAPAPVAQGAGAAGQDLESKAGLFLSERTGEPLRLIVERGTLRMAGGPPLIPVTSDRFRPAGASLSFMSQDEFELHFLSQDQFELTSMEGETTTYRRAQPYAPTLADLEAFAGRYESDEIGSVFQIAAGERGLMVRLAHAPARTLEVRPVAPDTFQAGMVTVRFHRNETGNVVALGYSNPVLRDVTFTRLSDRTAPR
jgi:CubicO group peptidase (beta-lactamase class C family)